MTPIKKNSRLDKLIKFDYQNSDRNILFLCILRRYSVTKRSHNTRLLRDYSVSSVDDVCTVGGERIAAQANCEFVGFIIHCHQVSRNIKISRTDTLTL